MAILQAVNQESQSLTPSALLNLFTLDLSPIGDNTQYYFVDFVSANYKSVVFDGVTYPPFPIQIKGMGYDGQGAIVRPKLTVANPKGLISALLLQNQDLVGAAVTITRVFARFIDAVNFPGGVSPYTPDPTAAYAPEVFFINRKTGENQATIEWELATAFELDSRRLPSRTMLAGFCQWRFRDGITCGYSGAPVCDSLGRLFSGAPYNIGTLTNRGVWNAATTYHSGDYVTIFSANQSLLGVPQVFVCTNTNVNSNPFVANNGNWALSGCPKTCAGCRLHFPASVPPALPVSLPFGGYPGISRAPFVGGYATQYT